MVRVRVISASEADNPVLRHLLELYQHDFSEIDGRDVDHHGLYGHRYLDHYWVDRDRRPFLFEVDGRWAEFALVRLGPPIDMAEFFVLRRFRRTKVGRGAALQTFRILPGTWQLRPLRTNPDATTFWRRIIPVDSTEVDGAEGPVQHFAITTSDGAAART